jgi:hypothetical protein
VLNTIRELLGKCGSGDSVLPPTELYNEGWMLRLVLNCLEHNRDLEHDLSFLPGSRWYSEALLASQFLPERRDDDRAESFTHADGVIGHFSIRPGERGEAVLLPTAKQLIVIEAKLGSPLSSGVKNDPDFDQAARNVACMAHLIGTAGVSPKSMERLGFFVVAPEQQVQTGLFNELVTKDSIRRKVAYRVAQYRSTRDAWFRDVFEPVLEHSSVKVLTWEAVIYGIASDAFAAGLQDFYRRCLEFNPLRAGAQSNQHLNPTAAGGASAAAG